MKIILNIKEKIKTKTIDISNIKHKISKELYSKYKSNLSHALHVVKLPKCKNGKFYHILDINGLENVSFLRETNKNYLN